MQANIYSLDSVSVRLFYIERICEIDIYIHEIQQTVERNTQSLNETGTIEKYLKQILSTSKNLN